MKFARIVHYKEPRFIQMTSDLQKRMKVKLFVGCLLTSDLGYHLEKSHFWKELSLAQIHTHSPQLQQVRFKSKSYFGSYCKEESQTIPQLESLRMYIEEKFAECCPSAAMSRLKTYIFPQLFIS